MMAYSVREVPHRFIEAHFTHGQWLLRYYIPILVN
jgi:hypothetical protein